MKLATTRPLALLLASVMAAAVLQSRPALAARPSTSSLLRGGANTDARAADALRTMLSAPAVPQLNVEKYLGRWYQMYINLLVNVTTEPDGFCATADYGLNPNGTVSVLNAETKNSPQGPWDSIPGYAFIANKSAPGELTVHLDGVPVDAPYWIVLLGPESYGSKNLYEYAVVSDPFEFTLFVLARDPVHFRLQYNEKVQQWLSTHGFDKFWNKPEPTYQGTDCRYRPIPTM